MIYEVDEEALAEFIEWRKTELKKPMGPIAIKMARKRLSQWPAEFQRLSIEESILSGWQGLFPPKVAGPVNREVQRQDAGGRYVNPKNSIERAHNADIECRENRTTGGVAWPDDVNWLWGAAHKPGANSRDERIVDPDVVELIEREKRRSS